MLNKIRKEFNKKYDIDEKEKFLSNNNGCNNGINKSSNIFKPHIFSNIDVLVADPPRNGLGEDLVNLISDL